MKPKKLLTVSAIVLAALLVGAVLLGILNATVGGGSWSLGWTNYRYDDSAYEIGDGTVPAPAVETIRLDWLDGRVTVEVCDDMFLSLTEEADVSLGEDTQLRRCLSEDGKTLSIKHRKSSSFLGTFGNDEKDLILRVPRSLFGQLKSLEITTTSASVTVKGIEADRLSVKTSSGTVSLSLPVCPPKITVETKSGDVALSLSEDCGFSLGLEGDPDRFTCDFPVKEQDGRYLCGTPAAVIDLKTPGGTVKLLQIEE